MEPWFQQDLFVWSRCLKLALRLLTKWTNMQSVSSILCKKFGPRTLIMDSLWPARLDGFTMWPLKTLEFETPDLKCNVATTAYILPPRIWPSYPDPFIWGPTQLGQRGLKFTYVCCRLDIKLNIFWKIKKTDERWRRSWASKEGPEMKKNNPRRIFVGGSLSPTSILFHWLLNLCYDNFFHILLMKFNEQFIKC